jgi:hypothetical protein
MIKHHKFYTRIDARGLALKLARKDARLKKEDALSDARNHTKRSDSNLARKRVKGKNPGQTSGARKLALKLARLQIETKYV